MVVSLSLLSIYGGRAVFILDGFGLSIWIWGPVFSIVVGLQTPLELSRLTKDQYLALQLQLIDRAQRQLANTGRIVSIRWNGEDKSYGWITITESEWSVSKEGGQCLRLLWLLSYIHITLLLLECPCPSTIIYLLSLQPYHTSQSQYNPPTC